MIFYFVNYNVIWAAIISALIGAGAVFAYFSFFKKKDTADVKQEKAPKSADVIVGGIAENAEAFSEMYEPLWSVANGSLSKKEAIFDQWNGVAETVGFGEAFNEKFGGREKWAKGDQWAKKANELVKYIFKAGVIRSTEVSVVGDDTTAEKYVYAGSASIEAGTEYDVLAPYWELNGTIVDKGVIR